MSDQEYEYNEELIRARQKRRAEKRRKFLIKQRIFYGVCAAILILIIVLIFKACSGGKKEKPDPAPTPDQPEDNQVEPVEPEAEPNVATATLAAVGDIMVYDDQLADARGEDGVYDFAPCFNNVRSYLSAADLTVGNLESTFAGEPYQGKPTWRAPESLATALKGAGFDILQTANTYSIQNGIAGLQTTLSTIQAAGMDAVGTYASQEAAEENGGVLLKEVNGIKIAFIAFTKGVNSMSVPAGSEYAVNLLYTDYYTNYSQINTTGITSSISAAKALEPDIIIAMVHWGVEYETNPTGTQTEIADLMFENGVDVILGSHPHIVGGMETRTVTVNGQEKEVFLAYSLGNFLSGMTAAYAQDSLILNLEFTKDLDAGTTTISSISYIPVYMYDAGAGATQRYMLLDVYKEIDDYVAAATGCVDTATYNALTASLDTLHSVAGAQYDYKNQTPDDPAEAVPEDNPALIAPTGSSDPAEIDVPDTGESDNTPATPEE